MDNGTDDTDACAYSPCDKQQRQRLLPLQSLLQVVNAWVCPGRLLFFVKCERQERMKQVQAWREASVGWKQSNPSPSLHTIAAMLRNNFTFHTQACLWTREDLMSLQ